MPVRKLEQSLMVSLPGGDQLHIRRLTDNPDGPPVMLLHGLLEGGTLFYARDGHGLAHFLAQHGFDVFVPDFRGKGRSWPPVSRWSSYRVNEAVTQDMPAILDAIQGQAPRSVADSYGDVTVKTMAAAIAKLPRAHPPRRGTGGRHEAGPPRRLPQL